MNILHSLGAISLKFYFEKGDDMENLEKVIIEAVYGFCCNDMMKTSEIKSFVCREFINGGLVKAEDKEMLSSEVDNIIKFLRRINCLNIVFLQLFLQNFNLSFTFSDLIICLE